MAFISLKNKRDFEAVFKKGKGFREGFLFLKLLPKKNDKFRLGIIVSQKISKKATTRNKIRRRIKAMINQKLPEIKNGFDAIISALPGIDEENFWEIEKALDRLLTKTKVKN